MCRFVFCSLAVLCVCVARAQSFVGQWKGTFSAFGSRETSEYVLEIEETSPGVISGYSYTYFYDQGQRWFTICSITGKIDRAAKIVTVTETARVKGHTPPHNVDCLQTHVLQYFKGPDGESLEGDWKPAPGYDIRGCGFGSTVLVRRVLASLKTAPAPDTRKPAAHLPEGGAPPGGDSANVARVTRPPSPKTRSGAKPPAATAKTHPATAPSGSSAGTKPAAKPRPSVNPPGAKPPVAKVPVAKPPVAKAPAAPGRTLRADTSALTIQPGGDRLSAPPTAIPITPPPPNVRRRTENIIQTIDLTSPEINIELYDDGIIDHDTVTVYFNGKAVVYKQMLKKQPIKATLTALPDRDNDLILYADNLGDIPPNTALMIVHAGGEQYDVRVESDFDKNGVVRFRLKAAAAKTGQ